VLSFAPSAAAGWHCDCAKATCGSNSGRRNVFSKRWGKAAKSSSLRRTRMHFFANLGKSVLVPVECIYIYIYVYMHMHVMACFVLCSPNCRKLNLSRSCLRLTSRRIRLWFLCYFFVATITHTYTCSFSILGHEASAFCGGGPMIK
jgi:hypothetical protein